MLAKNLDTEFVGVELPIYLFDDTFEIWKRMSFSVIKIGETVGPDDTIKLLLCLRLDFRIQGQREEEVIETSACLFSWIMSVGVRKSNRRRKTNRICRS